ncbi:MAG: DUF5606 domain-containing protein [Bacteroidetes bacterium]|nr:DUF5606 domain-containing protein [Bacteroidota bacterium]MCB0842154.1 DUF5606 domain-containing protein [Bacteroidota bacterium]
MSIGIKDVVAITGSPGLYQILKADDKAIVIESMDNKKRRQLVKGNMMVTKLVDVSIYTEDDSEPLVNVLTAVKEKYGSDLPVSKKSSNDELMDFLREVLPTLDDEKVYPSNVKKLISWYKILEEFEVDLTIEEEEEEASSEEKTEEKKEEKPKAEKKEKKPAAKKTKKKKD